MFPVLNVNMIIKKCIRLVNLSVTEWSEVCSSEVPDM